MERHISHLFTNDGLSFNVHILNINLFPHFLKEENTVFIPTIQIQQTKDSKKPSKNYWNSEQGHFPYKNTLIQLWTQHRY